MFELWGRTLRWHERLKALSGLPLLDAEFNYDVAFDVSDHALVVLGCCDAMRDWLLNSEAKVTAPKSDVDALYGRSPELRACRDIVNTSKHLQLRLDRRYFAALPLTAETRAAIAEEGHRAGATTVSPEEFLTWTEPFFVAVGSPPRLLVLFPGIEQKSFNLIQLTEACVVELGGFLEHHGLLPDFEGKRRAYGYPRKPA